MIRKGLSSPLQLVRRKRQRHSEPSFERQALERIRLVGEEARCFAEGLARMAVSVFHGRYKLRKEGSPITTAASAFSRRFSINFSPAGCVCCSSTGIVCGAINRSGVNPCPLNLGVNSEGIIKFR